MGKVVKFWIFTLCHRPGKRTSMSKENCLVEKTCFSFGWLVVCWVLLMGCNFFFNLKQILEPNTDICLLLFLLCFSWLWCALLLKTVVYGFSSFFQFSDILIYTCKGVTLTNQFRVRGQIPLDSVRVCTCLVSDFICHNLACENLTFPLTILSVPIFCVFYEVLIFHLRCTQYYFKLL